MLRQQKTNPRDYLPMDIITLVMDQMHLTIPDSIILIPTERHPDANFRRFRHQAAGGLIILFFHTYLFFSLLLTFLFLPFR